MTNILFDSNVALLDIASMYPQGMILASSARTLDEMHNELVKPLPRRTVGSKPGFKIKKVIFSGPCTIVLWTDGTKTIVRCGEDEYFDKEKGFAMAVAKKALGNKGSYFNEFKKWCFQGDEYEENKN